MASKKTPVNWKRIGHYSFIAGIIVALIIGFLPIVSGNTAKILFAVLGIIVGLLNITAKETMEFLVAALVLLISASLTYSILGIIPLIDFALTNAWQLIIVFVAWSAIIVAIKTVFVLAER